MGLNYSFEIIAPRDSVARLVEALAAHLVPDDAGRLLDAVREDPGRLMSVVRRGSHEAARGRGELCLTFLFEPDDWFAKNGWADHLDDPATGRVAIGCVWSSLRCGDRFVLFRGTAATTSMSQLFEQSPNVWEIFARVGREARAALVAFDDEEDELVGVWPRQGRAGACVVDSFVLDEVYQLRVDPYCEAVLGAFGAGPLGQAPNA